MKNGLKMNPEFKEKLLSGFNLLQMCKEFKATQKEIIETIKELESGGKLVSGFLTRFMEREAVFKNIKKIKVYRDKVLEELLKGVSVDKIRKDLGIRWYEIKMIKDFLIEEGAYHEELYHFNVVDFLDYWKRGYSLSKMERLGLAHQPKIRKCRDWLLKNKWILPRI